MDNYKDTLVVLMNNQADFDIAKTQGWYRIPVRHTPSIVKEGQLKFIAFYFTKAFGNDKYTIKWFAEVNDIGLAKRTELFPDETPNSKTKKQYYKISFSAPNVLYRPIVSARPRRLLFVPTTSYKLFNALEFNDIFDNSLLEEKVWKAFLKRQIYVERQFRVDINPQGSQSYHLDFAIFCKRKNIGVECVMPANATQFTNEEIAQYRQAKNTLENLGWSMYYLTPNQVDQKLDEIFAGFKTKIIEYGGLKPPEYGFKYLNPNNDNQLDLELF
ncbi:hypothetical protein [Microscilla marina]|uniref:DUF559 domain-containing protein n=1 Tax=Microscilla marina ATCC 23134 TaxID=313606 RepID=A1ZC32_MICM2|nr:hypothetical protein [Microscilla marina]EAY31834.1 hypothetical protein M23134_01863 [Microscilla marina ATCC 23134]